MKNETIKIFSGEHRWLSNFAPVNIQIGKCTFRSVEHAYQSEKSNEKEWKICCLSIERPGDIKKMSRKIKLSSDWEERKVTVMKACLEQKYNQEPFKSLLIKTAPKIIQEGNYWHDTFWGVDLKTGKGRNVLGKLIMQIRYKLLQKIEQRCGRNVCFWFGTIKENCCLQCDFYIRRKL